MVNKVTISHRRRGGSLELVETKYVIGRKPCGSPVVRLVIQEELVCKKGDTLVFDFTLEKSAK
jgi:hypothetical protein